MKLNIFKVDDELLDSLCEKLISLEYSIASEFQEGEYRMTLYLQRRITMGQGWLDFYKEILTSDTYDYYSKDLGNEAVSGVYLIKSKNFTYAIVNGFAHFIVRKYCDKDFGLNLAERIANTEGLKMKHSQTFTSARKKDITAYSQNRKVNDTYEYGEAFNYVKCKTVNKEMWGETVDFGESARFSLSNECGFTAKNLFLFINDIDMQLAKDPVLKLPRYQKVTNKDILSYLDNEINKRFLEIINDVDIDDYWLTGISFNFSNDFYYLIKKRSRILGNKLSQLDIGTIKQVLIDNKHIINDEYNQIKVYFYDENNKCASSSKLLKLMQVSVEYDGIYYVYLNGIWVRFSDSYIKYIEEQVDDISFEIKEAMEMGENELIATLVANGEYTQLHKNNAYIGKYCIEQADLMDDENVIMIKDQHQQSDLVYLVKQATTSLRLTESGELKTNIFKGRSVCLWMLVKRKKLKKLSDFKSFHLLDALNDFKKEVTSKNLSPVVWISLKS